MVSQYETVCPGHGRSGRHPCLPSDERALDAADAVDGRAAQHDRVLDLAVHERFREILDGIVAEGVPLVVADVSEVEFMDSTMLREVLRAHRSLEEAGARLVVAGAQPAVTRLLELTGTDEVLALADSRDAALA